MSKLKHCFSSDDIAGVHGEHYYKKLEGKLMFPIAYKYQTRLAFWQKYLNSQYEDHSNCYKAVYKASCTPQGFESTESLVE
jgi:hypothetical protein